MVDGEACGYRMFEPLFDAFACEKCTGFLGPLTKFGRKAQIQCIHDNVLFCNPTPVELIAEKTRFKVGERGIVPF